MKNLLMLLFFATLIVVMNGCTTINYSMDNNIFLRCQKTILEKDYDCEIVNERRFEEDIKGN